MTSIPDISNAIKRLTYIYDTVLMYLSTIESEKKFQAMQFFPIFVGLKVVQTLTDISLSRKFNRNLIMNFRKIGISGAKNQGRNEAVPTEF